jgi:hypothetical protein
MGGIENTCNHNAYDDSQSTDNFSKNCIQIRTSKKRPSVSTRNGGCLEDIRSIFWGSGNHRLAKEPPSIIQYKWTFPISEWKEVVSEYHKHSVNQKCRQTFSGQFIDFSLLSDQVYHCPELSMLQLLVPNCLIRSLCVLFVLTLQVLPERTHPEMMMGGQSGFILTGITVKKH